MRLVTGLLCFAALAGLAVRASAETIRHCELTVGGKTYISGQCDFEPIGGGDFIIRKGKYFAYIYVSAPASGHWNGDPPGDHAHTPLGELRRQEGCWANEKARVCAER